MGLNVNNLPKTSTPRDRVPQPNLTIGSHAARVVQVIDLGVQAQRPFQGKEKPPVQMIYITYEMSHDYMIDKDGKVDEKLPRWVSEDFPLYSLDADKAKSTTRYKTLDPTGAFKGDFSKVLGAACGVVIVHNKSGDNTYDNVGALTPPVSVPGYVQPQLVNPPVAFDLSDPDVEVFKKFPEFLQKRIKSNLHYNGSVLQKLLGEVAASAAPVASAPAEQEDVNYAAEENPL